MIRPTYWRGCPSVYGQLCCTVSVGHEGRHSVLNERFWTDDETETGDETDDDAS